MPSDIDVWQPLYFDASEPDDRRVLASLRSEGRVWAEHDTLEMQLLDLMETRSPRLRELAPAERRPVLEGAVRDHLGDKPVERWGRFVYYPWSGQLVRVLPPDEFRELRLDRKRNKLSTLEMALLRTKTVGSWDSPSVTRWRSRSRSRAPAATSSSPPTSSLSRT
jgi:hypothetical protein